MLFKTILLTVLLPATICYAAVREVVQAAYVFSRHGDRVAKSNPPTDLTTLGYQQVYDSGQYFRRRYIAEDASHKIQQMNADLVRPSQIRVSSPADTVLQTSAQGFLQGLYPPVGSFLSTTTLRNGSKIQAPMDGYQLLPILPVSNGASNEDAAWLQSSSNCPLAEASGQNFYKSAEYLSLLDSTQPFYDSIAPMIRQTFSSAQISYKNAYMIYDALHVASIHNATFPSSELLTSDTMDRLRTLAHVHEYDLAYNASDPIRAITGAITASDVVKSLARVVESPDDAPQLFIHFGAYAGMLSFFGLADLPSASADFFGIPDYASTLIWELVTLAEDEEGDTTNLTDSDSSAYYVRFLFHNGTATLDVSEPTIYPLFGQDKLLLPWVDFLAGMTSFAIPSESAEWCEACGNITSVCAWLLDQVSEPRRREKSSSALTTTQAAVIGAMVTLVGITLGQIAIATLAGFRLVKKEKKASSEMAGWYRRRTGSGNRRAEEEHKVSHRLSVARADNNDAASENSFSPSSMVFHKSASSVV